MPKSIAIAAQGVRHVTIPDDASPEFVWVTARAVCSAFGAVLFKGGAADFPNQFAQSVADSPARAWRAGGHFWSSTMGFDRSQQRGPGARRLRPDEPDPRSVMELLVGGPDELPWETARAVRNTFGHAFLRDRYDHDPDRCSTCSLALAGSDGEPKAWDAVPSLLDAERTLALDLYHVLRSGEPSACPLLPPGFAPRHVGCRGRGRRRLSLVPAMNGNEATGQERLTDAHVQAVREALGSYASAKGIEDGLERARDAIVRQLADARGETYDAWTALTGALDEEASAEGEGRP